MTPRALQKGMLGVRQLSLMPSLAALGPNRYLRERDFLTMLGVAGILHVVVLVVMSLLPKEEVTDIPVRALSFKIGGQDRIAAFGAPTGVGATIVAAQPASPAPAAAAPASDSWHADTQPNVTTPPPLKPIPRVSTPAVKMKTVPIVPPEKRQMPVENRTNTLPPLRPLPMPTPPVAEPTPPTPSPLPSTEVLTQVAAPAIAPTPQRYVREVGAAPQAGIAGAAANMGLGSADGAVGGKGTENIMTPQTAENLRQRYTQQISAWVQKHQYYPVGANGRAGKVVLRVQIDRLGYVRNYKIERGSGNAALDNAAIEILRRANPMPRPPADYPDGDLLEFRVPLNFLAPQ